MATMRRASCATGGRSTIFAHRTIRRGQQRAACNGQEKKTFFIFYFILYLKLREWRFPTPHSPKHLICLCMAAEGVCVGKTHVPPNIPTRTANACGTHDEARASRPESRVPYTYLQQAIKKEEIGVSVTLRPLPIAWGAQDVFLSDVLDAEWFLFISFYDILGMLCTTAHCVESQGETTL